MVLFGSRLQYYLVQDRLYLHNYIQVCRTLAGRSTEQADKELFTESALLSEESELGLQEHLFTQLQLELSDEPPGPATLAYMEQENMAVTDPSPLVALAGATPCNVLYADIGNRLLHRKEVVLDDHPFHAWLELYGDPVVQELAERWVACLNRWAEGANTIEQGRAVQVFRTSVECEVHFWQQAWEVI